jgi:K+-sensing histidine kinase KdpD
MAEPQVANSGILPGSDAQLQEETTMAIRTSISVAIFESSWKRYAVALSAMAIALLLHRVLNIFLGDFAPYIALFPAVAFSAMYCGLGPSIASTILALLAAKFWFIPVTHSLTIDQSQVFGLLEFLLATA